jgi:hypothetical protein
VNRFGAKIVALVDAWPMLLCQEKSMSRPTIIGAYSRVAANKHYPFGPLHDYIPIHPPWYQLFVIEGYHFGILEEIDHEGCYLILYEVCV